MAIPKSEQVRLWGCWGIIALLILVATSLLMTTASAQAKAGSAKRLLASRTLQPAQGGYVTTKSGVSLYVPPGRMDHAGKATITEVHHRVYDIHIHAPWHGLVAVTMPPFGHGDGANTIIHRVGSLWVTEPSKRGERTVWVDQLSWFSDQVAKVASKVAGALCLSTSLGTILKCAAQHAIGYVDGKLADWIFSHIPDSCVARLAYAGVTAARGGPIALFVTILVTENTDGLCTPHAGEAGYHVPDTSSSPATSSPGSSTPSSSPPAAPPPPPPPPSGRVETTGGVTHTWTNYTNAGGYEGPIIPSNQSVLIACKLTGFRVADGNTWWYRIASSPWNGAYYASADAFYNNGQTSGSLLGTPFVDSSVPDC